jgi:hypothetical protein
MWQRGEPIDSLKFDEIHLSPAKTSTLARSAMRAMGLAVVGPMAMHDARPCRRCRAVPESHSPRRKGHGCIPTNYDTDRRRPTTHPVPVPMRARARA